MAEARGPETGSGPADGPLTVHGEASGVILAGGKSTRMGRDKLRLEVDGVPLLQRVYGALSARCGEVVVVGERGDVARFTSLEGARRIPDERPGEGPLAGMEAGLAAARNRLVFVAAGDMPFLPEGLIAYSLERLEERELCAVVPRHGGRTHPLCAAYDRKILPRVRVSLDEGIRTMRRFLEVLDRVEYAEEELRRFGNADLFLMNVNSPEDLERARAWRGRVP